MDGRHSPCRKRVVRPAVQKMTAKSTAVQRAEVAALRAAWRAGALKRQYAAAKAKHLKNPKVRRAQWRAYDARNSAAKKKRLQKWRDSNREHIRSYNGKRRGHLPVATRAAPANCECCRKPRTGMKSALCLDHDHTTGKFRGWLCGHCNRAIGQLGDNLTGLMRAVRYLRRAKK
jgi:hypothetical protein